MIKIFPQMQEIARRISSEINIFKKNPRPLSKQEIQNLKEILEKAFEPVFQKGKLTFFEENIRDLMTPNGTRIIEETTKDKRVFRQILFFQNTNKPDCVRILDGRQQIIKSFTLNNDATKIVSIRSFSSPMNRTPELTSIHYPNQGIETIPSGIPIIGQIRKS